jgi:hypothetical protein
MIAMHPSKHNENQDVHVSKEAKSNEGKQSSDKHLQENLSQSIWILELSITHTHILSMEVGTFIGGGSLSNYGRTGKSGKHLSQRSEAISGAAGIGDNIEIRCILVLIHTHDKHWCIFARC